MRVCFIFLSNGEEEHKDGQTLTYINQAFNLSSMSISNPKS